MKKKQKETIMMNAVTLNSEEEFTTVNAFTITVNINGKRSWEEHAYITSLLPSTSSDWILDSDAFWHMSSNIKDFFMIQSRSSLITVTDELQLSIEGVSTVHLRCWLSDRSTKISELTNILYSHELQSTRLFSWPYIWHKDYIMKGQGDDMFLLNTEGIYTVWACYLREAMQIQDGETDDKLLQITASACFDSYMKFHINMRHASVINLICVYKDEEIISEKSKDFHCDTCHLFKLTHTHSKSTSSQASAPFELIYSDLSDKFFIKSIEGFKYFITFIDDCTRFIWVWFIFMKSDTADVIKQFLVYIKTQFELTIKWFHSDNDEEYMKTACQDVFKNHEIQWESITSYSHESNDVAEHFNRTVIMTACTMIEKNSHLFLWSEAIHTTAFLQNIMSHSSLFNHVTLFEALFKRKLFIKHLHLFSQSVYMHISAEAWKSDIKLLHRAEWEVIIDYSKSLKIYWVYISDWHIIVETQDVKFEPFTQKVKYDHEIDMNNSSIIKDHSTENSTSLLQKNLSDYVQTASSTTSVQDFTTASVTSLHKAVSMNMLSDSPSQIPVHHSQSLMSIGTELSSELTDTVKSSATVIRCITRSAVTCSTTSQPSQSTTTRADRVTKSTSKTQGLLAFTYTNMKNDDNNIYIFAVQSNDSVLTTLSQVKASSDWSQWEKAIHQELKSHDVNDIWTPVKHSSDIRNVIGSWWVFAIKHDIKGNVIKHKARVVAQGFSQIHSINFEEMYAPVIRYDSLQLLLWFITLYDYHIHQMNFNTAYLNSLLKEDIYMHESSGYSEQGMIYKVLRALYDLKQSEHEWFRTLHDQLLSLSFIQMTFNSCIFIIEHLFIAIYVNDLLILSTMNKIRWFKITIFTAFFCKDLSQIKYLLGLKIDVTDTHISISQAFYAQQIIQWFDMNDVNLRMTSLNVSTFSACSQESENSERTKEYQQLISSLNYLVIRIRSDLVFTVLMLRSFNANSSDVHLKLTK